MCVTLREQSEFKDLFYKTFWKRAARLTGPISGLRVICMNYGEPSPLGLERDP